MDKEHIAKLIEDMSASLQTEMARRFDAVDRRFDNVYRRFDEVDRRLDGIQKTQKRHSALFTADALAVRGMERTVMDHDERLSDLRRRVEKLEGGGKLQ